MLILFMYWRILDHVSQKVTSLTFLAKQDTVNEFRSLCRLSLEECLKHPWVLGQPLPPKTRLEPPVKWVLRQKDLHGFSLLTVGVTDFNKEKQHPHPPCLPWRLLLVAKGITVDNLSRCFTRGISCAFYAFYNCCCDQ